MAHRHPSFYAALASSRALTLGQVGATAIEQPSIPLRDVMSVTLASQVPYKNGSVLVDEAAYAATRTPEALHRTLDALDKAVMTAPPTRLAGLGQTIAKVGAAKAVRAVAANPAAQKAVNDAAKSGSAEAQAVVTAVGIAKLADMKVSAQAVARAAAAGDPDAISAVKKLSAVAGTPGPKQAHAFAMGGMVAQALVASGALPAKRG